MKVRCIDDKGLQSVRKGKEYIVNAVDSKFYVIVGIEGVFKKERFEIVEEPKTYSIQEVFEFEEGTQARCQGTICTVNLEHGTKVLINGDTGNKFYLTSNALNARFTLIKQDKQVPFIEAMKAYGKTVYCKYNFAGTEFIGTYKIDSAINQILDVEKKDAITPREILEGKWFIKED